MVTGHPGNIGMIWHMKNFYQCKTYRRRQRGACRGCVYGTMHQTGTDHRREHRDLPINQDNVSLWMHTSTIAIPQEDISIVIYIRI